jgi:hypothetical protein
VQKQKGGFMCQSEEEYEKRVNELMDELAQVRKQAEESEKQLEAELAEKELMRRLASEGTRDLEAAVLIAKARLTGKSDAGSKSSPQADLGGIVEQLRKEKGYLFHEKASEIAPMRTLPAKEQRNPASALERAAKKAAATGNRSDLQEYMRKRRSVA